MLKTLGLHHQYDKQTILTFPDLQLDYGQSLLLTGNSGSGKTTLLHLITWLLPIQKVNIEVDKLNYQNLSASQMYRFRGSRIGIIFQQNHFIKSMTVR